MVSIFFQPTEKEIRKDTLPLKRNNKSKLITNATTPTELKNGFKAKENKKELRV